MNLRALSVVVAAACAFMAPLLAPATASAQEPDGARFRGGVGLTGGAFVLSGDGESAIIGSFSVQGQLGVQIDNNWAVYALPQIGLLFGSDASGANFGAGVLGEYTFSAVPISVGAGPYAGAIVVGSNGDAGAGGYAGGLIHVAGYPVMARSENGIRRRALSIGLDLGVYSAIGGGGIVIISPTVSVGFLSF